MEGPPQDLNGYDPIATAAPGDWFDADRAAFIVGFFETNLRHAKGRWNDQPFLLDQQWQRDYIRTLFGWRRADGTRRYRRSYFSTGRKQGKTNTAAGIANATLFCDGEDGAEVYCTGADRENAAILFDAAAHHVQTSPALRRLSKVLPSKRRIVYRRRHSTFTALPASEKGGHGASTHCVVYDELHLYTTGRHVEMYESLHTSTANREQPLEVITTTAGWDRTSLCWQEYEYALKVRDGRIADREFLPLIYEAQPHEDWTDPAVWRRACPNLGVTVTEEFLRAKCEEAKHNPRKENTFRRHYLNQWVSQESRWLSMRDWDECWGSGGGFAAGETRYGGLDLSQTVDLTAFVQVARRPGGGFRVRGHYWAPQTRVVEMRQQGLPVEAWIRGGWLTPIAGAVIDQQAIRRHVLTEHARGGLVAVGYDPAHATQLRLDLEAAGVTMAMIRQGAYTLSEPCKALEAAVRSGKLDHFGDPVLAWAVENCEVHTDSNGNIRPVKPAHGSPKKVDPVSATATAIATLIATPEPVRLVGRSSVPRLTL